MKPEALSRMFRMLCLFVWMRRISVLSSDWMRHRDAPVVSQRVFSITHKGAGDWIHFIIKCALSTASGFVPVKTERVVRNRVTLKSLLEALTSLERYMEASQCPHIKTWEGGKIVRQTKTIWITFELLYPKSWVLSEAQKDRRRRIQWGQKAQQGKTSTSHHHDRTRGEVLLWVLILLHPWKTENNDLHVGKNILAQ